MTQSEFEHIAQELRSQMLKVALDFFGRQWTQRVWSGCQGGEELLCQPL